MWTSGMKHCPAIVAGAPAGFRALRLLLTPARPGRFARDRRPLCRTKAVCSRAAALQSTQSSEGGGMRILVRLLLIGVVIIGIVSRRDDARRRAASRTFETASLTQPT